MADHILKYSCPSCNKDVKIKAPAVSGIYNVTCPHCKKATKIKLPGMDKLQPGAAPQTPPAHKPAVPPVPPMPPTPPAAPAAKPADEPYTETHVVGNHKQKGAGKLAKIGKMFNDYYELPIGEHTIGRYDETCRSDIQVKGDSYMSRRSICINVTFNSLEGFSYLLRVLQATNPVTLNGHPLANGSETYLNFGDIITLGHTKFRLDAKL